MNSGHGITPLNLTFKIICWGNVFSCLCFLSANNAPQSALKHLFWMSKYTMSSYFAEQLKQFTQGIRRTVADKKKEQGDNLMIGKKKMEFKVYQKICELFLGEEGEEFIFACCFLTLEWNLMA